MIKDRRKIIECFDDATVDDMGCLSGKKADIVVCSLPIVIAVMRDERLRHLVQSEWMMKALYDDDAIDQLIFSATDGRYADPAIWAANMTREHEPQDVLRIWEDYIKAYKDNNGAVPKTEPVAGLSAVAKLIGVDSALSAYFDGVPANDIVA